MKGCTLGRSKAPQRILGCGCREQDEIGEIPGPKRSTPALSQGHPMKRANPIQRRTADRLREVRFRSRGRFRVGAWPPILAGALLGITLGAQVALAQSPRVSRGAVASEPVVVWLQAPVCNWLNK